MYPVSTTAQGHHDQVVFSHITTVSLSLLPQYHTACQQLQEKWKQDGQPMTACSAVCSETTSCCSSGTVQRVLEHSLTQAIRAAS